MTRVVIVADRESEMARLATSVDLLDDADVVRLANGRSSVARLVAAAEPSLVLVAELSPRRLTAERLTEIRAAAPDADRVVVAAAGSRWLADALRAGATAVLPGDLGADALAAVLQEVIATKSGGAAPLAHAA
jgi:DNA-binding NarL/FixJ family response regulator